MGIKQVFGNLKSNKYMMIKYLFCNFELLSTKTYNFVLRMKV